jgi:hypothetical protein
MDEDGLTFEQWFAAEGFADEHRAVLAQTWNAALDNAKREIDDEYGWALDKLRA